jgi:hypothetical protein
MRPSRILSLISWFVLIGCLLALLFIGLQTFRIRMETSDSFPEYSTYRADPKGLKALYASLQATDLLQVSRRLLSSKILSSGENQVLIVAGIQPDREIVSDEDSQFLDHWLATGGRLIIALRSEKNQAPEGTPTPQANQEITNDSSVLLWRSLIRRWGAVIVPTNEISSATAHSALFGTIPRWLGRNSFDLLTKDWKIIAVQGTRSVVIERAFAQGSLVLLADSFPLSNEALSVDRNTDFLLWLIEKRVGVMFDEIHLGLSEQPGIMTLAQRYGLQGTLVSTVAVLLLFIWKCQYTLVPRTKDQRKLLSVSGSSSDQVFLNLLQRTIARKDLLGVCLQTWLKTARPTAAQLARLEKFRSEPAEEQAVVGRYNQLTTLLNEQL